MEKGKLYSDKMVDLYNDRILLKRYSFLWFGEKVILFDEISKICIITPQIHNDTVRIQGWSDLKTRWPLDWCRPLRKKAFIIELKNKKEKIGFTVSNFEKFFPLLKNKLRDSLVEI